MTGISLSTRCFGRQGAGKRRKKVLPDVDGTKYLPGGASPFLLEQTGPLSSRELWLSMLYYCEDVRVASAFTLSKSSGVGFKIGF